METFEQLKMSKMKILSPHTSLTIRLLKGKGFSNSEIRNKLVTINETRYEVYEKMQANPSDYVYIDIPTYENYLHEFSKPQYGKFYESKESLTAMHTSLNYLKSFPYKEHFTRAIRRSHAMHIFVIGYERRRIAFQVRVLDKYHNRKEETPYIKTRQMLGAYLFVLAGYSLAGLLHIITLLKVNITSYIINTVMSAALGEVNAALTPATMQPVTNTGEDDKLEII